MVAWFGALWLDGRVVSPPDKVDLSVFYRERVFVTSALASLHKHSLSKTMLHATGVTTWYSWVMLCSLQCYLRLACPLWRARGGTIQLWHWLACSRLAIRRAWSKRRVVVPSHHLVLSCWSGSFRSPWWTSATLTAMFKGRSQWVKQNAARCDLVVVARRPG
jgi:hypothetical protein